MNPTSQHSMSADDGEQTVAESVIATQQPSSGEQPTDQFSWQVPAEAITVRIRWFGLCVGYLLVNVLHTEGNRPELNAILTLGAVYALLDTWWSLQGKIFLRHVPWFVSAMEAVFIGLLCHFDGGIDSPFRFYYFLSLLVSAIRYPPRITYLTFVLHAVSYVLLWLNDGTDLSEQVQKVVLMLVFMGWVAWAGMSLVLLLKSAGAQLSALNEQLQRNQALLEQRISVRTKELQESQALIVQQEKHAAFGLLAAGIAHEVGNPLAAISSLVQMMNRSQLDDYMHEQLGLVDEQLRRIQRTLRELVDFSRPATTNIVRCNVEEVIESALRIAKYYKRKKGKEIITNFQGDLPSVTVVRDQLLQVFLNLILNALDATDEGDTVEISTQVIDDPTGRQIVADIQDNGSGISIENQQSLFTPYFTTKTTGTGLGLFVCRNIVGSFDGTIDLRGSAPGATIFRVTLPVRTLPNP